MRITSVRHALHWMRPDRIPEAVRRVVRARRGARWCREVTTRRAPSGRLSAMHTGELEAAQERVEAAPVRLGGAGNLDLVFDLCEEVQARRVVETGVAYGWSTLAILLSIADRGGHLWSTDLAYGYVDGSSAVGIAVPDRLRDAWTLLRGPDDEQVPVALEQAGTIDLAHYDSAKEPHAMLSTCRRLYGALRAGGVLVVDDVGDHLGFRTLVAELDGDWEVIAHDRKFQGVLRKR